MSCNFPPFALLNVCCVTKEIHVCRKPVFIICVNTFSEDLFTFRFITPSLHCENLSVLFVCLYYVCVCICCVFVCAVCVSVLCVCLYLLCVFLCCLCVCIVYVSVLFVCLYCLCICAVCLCLCLSCLCVCAVCTICVSVLFVFMYCVCVCVWLCVLYVLYVLCVLCVSVLCVSVVCRCSLAFRHGPFSPPGSAPLLSDWSHCYRSCQLCSGKLSSAQSAPQLRTDGLTAASGSLSAFC